MKRLAGLLLCPLLASCSGGDREAEKYQVLERNYGSSAELCAQARKTAQAYLDDGDEAGLAEWNIKADLCEAEAAIGLY